MYGLGKKIGMTRLFIDGVHTPVTVIQFNDQVVLQRKTKDKDGYSAIQIGTGSRRTSSKAHLGHIKKYSDAQAPIQKITEFRDVELPDDKLKITVSDFSVHSQLKVTGFTLGRGFTGAMKKYGFHGQPQTHGHDHTRAVGSIGSRWPQRVLPGKKMAGRQGNDQRTLNSVLIVAIDEELKLLFVKGSLPGSNNTYLKIKQN